MHNNCNTKHKHLTIDLRKLIEKWKKELKFLMILMNAKNIDELYGKIRKIDNI